MSDTAAESTSTTGGVDDRSLACAVGVLHEGQSGIKDVSVLTDEELMALDGTETPQLTAMPFLEDPAHEQLDRLVLARTAMRSLMVRNQVASEIEAAEFEERPLADDRILAVVAEPSIAGCLLLRRTSETLVWFERRTSSGLHRLYYYPHDSGVVLEEEVTQDGVHMFTVMPAAEVTKRAHFLIDQNEVGGEDGPSKTVALETADDDPDYGERLADTRAFTVANAVDRDSEVATRLTFHATSSEVIAGRLLEQQGGDDQLQLMPVSPETVDQLITGLFERTDA